MSKTNITLIRHGETEWNVAMRLQGIGDSKLTSEGVRQVQALAARLRDQTYDVILSSDLGRARQTAEIINRYHNRVILYMETIRERNFGVMEGHTGEEIQKQYKDVYESYLQRNADYIIPGGESLTAFYWRIIQAMNAIVTDYAGKKILIITHGGVLDCILRMIFNYPLGMRRNFSIYNASVNRISCKNNEWTLEEWGNTGALSQISVLTEFAPDFPDNKSK